MITEIYVSIDGFEFTKLDLFKDESFVMKYSKKDIQDITKVFAPFSQNFSFPATPKNKQTLGFFGNTEVVKINPDNKFKCKIYSKGILNQSGILKLESVKYKNGVASNFVGSFNTTFLSLKDRIGNDTLNDLSDLDNSISFKADNVFDRLRGTATKNGIKYYIPLFSNNRVWNYNIAVPSIDNIAYKSSSAPDSDKVINIGELRPCVSMLSLLNLIKTKYNLTIITPLESKNELKEAYIWCNGKDFTRQNSNKFILEKQYYNEEPSTHGSAVVNLVDSSILLSRNNQTSYIQYRITLNNTIVGDLLEKAQCNIEIVRKSTGEKVLDFEFEVGNGTNVLAMAIPLYLFSSNQFEFFTYIKFSKPVFWKSSESRFLYRGILTDKVSTYFSNFNSNETGSYKVDLIKSLPSVKVLDFLTSYFKTFNISIFDSSPIDENLFFLTPQDVNSTNEIYSKSEVDYTRYTDLKEVTKSVGNEYNYYNFKHKTSGYRSNVDFKKQFNVEYGQVFYPAIKPTKANEFKVETEFSIVPPVLINGNNVAWTIYGFTNDAPEIDDDGRFRYQPNLDELTIFYNHGSISLSGNSLGCQNVNALNNLVTSPLTSYLRSMPYCLQNGNSLSFSILVINLASFPLTLYSLYYSQFISRLLNPNALIQTFSLTLPASEIYLNDANINAGSGLTPKGFRLQNEIIIGETKHEIIDASIDISNGKTKITTLNF